MRHRRRGRNLGQGPQSSTGSAAQSGQRLAPDRARRRAGRQQAQGHRPHHHHAPKGQGSPPAGRAVRDARPPQPCRTPKRPSAFATDGDAQSAEHGRRGARANAGKQWNQAIAPVVAARRRALVLLGDKQAVRHALREDCPAIYRSPRRLHPRPAAGQAAAGRCRHAGDFWSSSAFATGWPSVPGAKLEEGAAKGE